MNTDYLLSVFLLIVCVGLTIVCGNTNHKLLQCLSTVGHDNDNNGPDGGSGSNNNGEGSDNGSGTDDDSAQESCNAIRLFAHTQREKLWSLNGVVFPKNTEDVDILDKSYLLQQIISYTSRTGEYNVDALQTLAKKFPNDFTFVPRCIGYCMVLTKFKRDETLEKILLSFMNDKKNDPLSVDNISYFVIFLNYQKYHKLDLFKPSKEMTDRMDNVLNSSLNYQSYPFDASAPNVHDLTDGFYRDGYIRDKIPGGIHYTTMFVPSLVYIGLSDRLAKTNERPLINETLQWIYKRLFFTVRRDYTQLIGGGVHVTQPVYRYHLLSTLLHLFAFKPTQYILTADVLRRIYNNSNINYLCDVLPSDKIAQSVADAEKMFQDLRVASRCEGFTFYANGWFTFEQSCTSPYIASTVTGSIKKNQMQFNTNFLYGYINYGCDYIAFMNTVNVNKVFVDALLPGHVVDKSATSRRYYPNTAMLVKLEKNLYYQSTHKTPIQANGIVDGETNTHRIYVKAGDFECRYCAFGWVSLDDVPIVKVADNRYLLYDIDMCAMISGQDLNGNESVVLVYQSIDLITGGRYNYFCVDIPANETRVITVSLARGKKQLDDVTVLDRINTKRIRNYEIVNELERDIQIQPDTNKSYCTIVKNIITLDRTLVDESVVLTSNNPVKATTIVDSKSYKFSDVSMGRAAFIPGTG